MNRLAKVIFVIVLDIIAGFFLANSFFGFVSGLWIKGAVSLVLMGIAIYGTIWHALI